MPQETNLNVTPYNDDYSILNGYYKVLFKPTNPVQARELNTVQSILQNQVEQFGSHIFKEGSVVIPGNYDFENNLSAVELQNSYNGVNISSYLNLLPGKTIRGKTSGVRAVIELTQTQTESIRGNNTIYIKYISSDSTTGTVSLFSDGEELIIEQSSTDTLESGELVVFSAGQLIAATITSNCNSTACSVTIFDGIYFVRGTFVNVFKHTILLEQYTNNPSCKVGFNVNESIVTAYDKEELFDNASGFSNYTAPGADRFSIDLTLIKYDLTEEKPDNFIQLLEIQNGVIASSQEIPQYNVLAKELARRTYDESGDYYVTTPSVSVKESLDNLLGNNGVYDSAELTYSGNKPDESLGIYQISPTKAFVQGYEVETGSVTVDFPKPRTTKLLQNQSINYYTGPTLTLNRVYGTPFVGISTNYTLSLRDSRVGLTQNSAPGKEIGLARVYDFALESGSYSTSNPNLNEWDLSLFDVQPYTEISINQNLTTDSLFNVPCQVTGKSSGASGYLRYDSRSSGIITAYDVRGSFAVGERLSFNGIENTRVATAVTSYSLNDAKSIYGIVGTAFTFTADVKQIPAISIGQVNITALDSTTGLSTVTLAGNTFISLANVGNLVAFTNPEISTITYARVSRVSTNTLAIAGVTTVSGICNGGLPTTSINPSDFTILSSKFTRSQDNTLYTEFAKDNVKNVNLTNSSLTIRRQIDVSITNNSIGLINADTNETFLPFDEERYALIREDGTTEILTSDKFVFTNGSQTLTINGLGTNSKAKLIVTLRKIKITEKVKYKNRVKTIVIDKSQYESSGIGTTTLNDGLSYGNFPYGTRVQDNDICLLTADVTKIYGVFESSTTNSATLPNLTLSGLSGPTNKTNDLLIGEIIIGSSSRAVAIYTEKVNDLQINVVYLNSSKFLVNEVIKFQDTGITANVSSIGLGDRNILSSFTFEPGQKSTIYDYSRLTRIANTREPSRKLTIVFESSDFLTSDVGDIVTVNSYSNFNYCSLLKVNGVSVTDIIDIRPRVSNYSVSSGSRSPFEFLGRDFSNTYLNPRNILASDESINLDYSFYLPRIDKIYLTQEGKIELASGSPSESPQPPNFIDNSIELATAYLPPYLCNVDDVELQLTTHKRYRMSDIRNLEDRIANLENYTSLTLLESETSNLFIPDSSGLNRFKSGFFVDNFSDTKPQQKVTIVKNSIDQKNNELRPAPFNTELDLVIASKSIIGIGTVADTLVDLRFVTDLLGSNIKKTGNLITLDYDEVVEITQPYSTRVENVAAYRNGLFNGSVTLSPASDVWADQVKVSTKYAETKPLIPSEDQKKAIIANQQIGMNPILWDYVSKIWSEDKTIQSAQFINFMRSRNIEFVARRMKPLAKVFSYFDGRGMDRFIIPKLIQIQMISGTFQVGETVIGSDSSGASIKFRVATSNHKFGPYNSPTSIYDQSPYSANTVPATYSSTSTLINVDTASLSDITQSNYIGYIVSGMRLKGQTSSAEATITSNNNLIADVVGDVLGTIFIPNSNVSGFPSFETGTRSFVLTNNASSPVLDNFTETFATSDFYSAGSLVNFVENIIRTEPRQFVSPSAPSLENAPNATSTQVQDNRPWQDGDIIIRGGKNNISDAEGSRLVDSINRKNGTSFSLSQLKSAAGVKRLDQLSELHRMNAAARRLAGK